MPCSRRSRPPSAPGCGGWSSGAGGWRRSWPGGTRLIEARGYPLQVSPQRGVSPLFLFRHGERRRIEWRGEDRFTLRGLRGGRTAAAPSAELLEIIDENPGVVSPGVLARPAIQDAVLGTAIQVVGPGELSYMAQAAVTHAVLEVEPTTWPCRPQTLLMEAKQAERVEELGLPLATLLGDRHRSTTGSPSARAATWWRRCGEQLEAALADLRGPAVAADPGLERPFEKTREQILRALDLFGEKAVAAAARKNEVVNRRVQQLRDACLPGGKLQERIVASRTTRASTARSWSRATGSRCELDAAHLQVIVPGLEESKP